MILLLAGSPRPKFSLATRVLRFDLSGVVHGRFDFDSIQKGFQPLAGVAASDTSGTRGRVLGDTVDIVKRT